MKKFLKGSLRGIIPLSVNFDGWRAIVIVNRVPELWTREKHKIDMPINLATQLRQLDLPVGTVLDGEIWNPLKRGAWKHSNGIECKLTLWDAIRYGTKDISTQPIEERRKALYSLLKPECEHIKAVEVLPATKENCQMIFKEAAEIRTQAVRSGFIHGVVLKKNGSPRRDHATRSTEHPDWLKIVFDGMSGWAIR
jgi:ATP-dependent DNA ligase